MNSEHRDKPFDCMKWLRETRDRIYEETKDLSPEEELRWFRRRPRDPLLTELFDRIPRTVPVKPSHGAHGSVERDNRASMASGAHSSSAGVGRGARS